MTVMPREIPESDVALDGSATYAKDVPFNAKQTVITHARHRWFQVISLGVPTGSQFGRSVGIPAGATQRIQFEHKPDYVAVGISGQTATTGRCMVFRGEPGGDGIPLGQSGNVIVPAPESGVLSIVNLGSTPTYGAVIAMAGYDTALLYQPGL